MSRSLQPRLSVPAQSAPDDTDYSQRHFVNLIAAAFLLMMAIFVTWTVRAVTENESQLRCIESGRRDCVSIVVNAPPRGMRAPTH